MKRKRGKASPGPKPERVKIDGNWKDAVKKAMEAPPPKEEDQTADDRPQTSDDPREA